MEYYLIGALLVALIILTWICRILATLSLAVFLGLFACWVIKFLGIYPFSFPVVHYLLVSGAVYLACSLILLLNSMVLSYLKSKYT